MLQFAKAVLEASHMMPMPHTGQPLRLRVGLHTGPCVSGLIGTKLPKFSIFGKYLGQRVWAVCKGRVGRNAAIVNVLI